MIYTVIKNDKVLYSGIFEPNIMNYRGLEAILIANDKNGNILFSKEI